MVSSTIAIRAAGCADAAAIARVSVDTWHSTYTGLVPASVLARMNYADRERTWAAKLCAPAPALFAYVATAPDGSVVGFASGGPEREADPIYTGELYALYIQTHHQRSGLGRRLVAAVAARLLTDGHRALLIWVLATNPARRFYERLGGVYLREQPLNLGTATLHEVAYSWSDLAALGQTLTEPHEG